MKHNEKEREMYVPDSGFGEEDAEGDPGPQTHDRSIRPQLNSLEVVAQAPVPTIHGPFEMIVFHWTGDDDKGLPRDHVALVRGDVRGRADVTVRVHSECMTSEVFGSLKCDCREQLQAAQAEIARRDVGVLLYLRQEGRGIGLPAKVRAYELQSRGHDTVDANRLLGLPDDARDYAGAAAMLNHLGIASIRLMTNNPEKEAALRKLGIVITSRAPTLVKPNAHSAGYLEAKRARMGHALPAIFGPPPHAPVDAPADAE